SGFQRIQIFPRIQENSMGRQRTRSHKKTRFYAGFRGFLGLSWILYWRPGSESNRRTRICSPLHDHSATWPVTGKQRARPPSNRTALRGPETTDPGVPGSRKPGAGNETRTRDPDLGKVVLYQLSYSRGAGNDTCAGDSDQACGAPSSPGMRPLFSTGHAARM